MDKESVYELQKIDCNCNDCGYMKRNLNKPPKKNTPSPINYGFCLRFNKQVSFIPAVLQLDTQDCFVHRKQLPPNQTK